MINIVKSAVIFLALLLAVPGLAEEEKSYAGTVKFAQTAGKYTYLKLDQQGKEVWLATLPLKVSVKDKVEYIGGDLMKNFHSRALNKTFDYILFVTRVRVLNGDSRSGKQSFPGVEYHENLPKKKLTIQAPKKSEIVKPEGGKTISEIFSERDKLKDKEVSLRARVMKVNKNIMSRNWVTLQDGTGDAPEDKLTATTAEAVNIGDILTVKGVLRTDKNIGAGYKYKVLLEDAKFTK